MLILSLPFRGFQFHKGAIRTLRCGPLRSSIRDFNSIKVRLELLWASSICFFSSYFNSIKVRLEQWKPWRRIFILYIFQFHKGAIRTKWHLPRCHQLGNFNSIKVRLEPLNQLQMLIDILFQFHKGAIRTHPFARSLNLSIYFNSIKVRLELTVLPHLQFPW